MKIKHIIAAGALSLCAGAATAATTTFNLAAVDSGNFRNSLSYTMGSLTLTVTGLTETGVVRQVATWAGNGLGVQGSGDTTHTIDSVGYDDIAVLTFSEAVTIESLGFRYITSGSVFELLAKTAGGVTSVAKRNAASLVANLGEAGVESTVWGVQATEWFRSCGSTKKPKTCEEDSGFKLANVTVVTEDPAPVPLPAAGVLLAGALGLLGVARRRGRATA